MNRSIFRLSAVSILACMTLMTGLISCTKSVEPYVICTGEDYREGSWYAFRKAFEWKGDPSEATLTIEADTKYWLWVNGELVVREGNLKRGPNPTDGYFDYFDTLPGLVRGHNEVAVLVNFHGRKSVNHITTPTAGLMFDLRTRSKAAKAAKVATAAQATPQGSGTTAAAQATGQGSGTTATTAQVATVAQEGWGGSKARGERIVSDDSWKVIRHPAFYIPEGGCPNSRLSESNVGFDARKDIPFYEVGFDDSSWSQAVALTRQQAGWGSSVRRPIPQWKDYGLKEYVSTRMEGRELICTLPYDCQVTPYIKVKAPEGKIIDFYTDLYGMPVIEGVEPLDDPRYNPYAGVETFIDEATKEEGKKPKKVDPNHNRTISETLAMTPEQYQERFMSFPLLCTRAQYTTREGVQEHEVPMWMNGMEVHYSIPEGVEVLEVKFRESGYDTFFAGSFKCSDPFLNTLWERAARTLYVNMRDNFFDCPHRERGQWIGDAANEAVQTFYALSPSAFPLTGKAIRELAGFQEENGSMYGPTPGYNYGELVTQTTAFLSLAIPEYYLYTGDITPLQDVYPQFKKYLPLWKTGPDGLIMERNPAESETPIANWGDWGENKDMMLLYNAWNTVLLRTASEYAALMGDEDLSKETALKREALIAKINEKYWRGGWYQSDGYSGCPDDRGQAVAVIGGAVDSSKFETLRPFFKKHEHSSPYMEYYVLRALCEMGYCQDALDRMRKRYAEMIASDYSTLWELFGDGSGKSDSYNHAWSGGPLTILSKYIAGVSPVEPGFAKFRVAPSMCDLNMVSACVASVKGDINVCFEKDAAGNVKGLVTVPEGTECEFVAPEGQKIVALDGNPAEGSKINLAPGRHEVEMKSVKAL